MASLPGFALATPICNPANAWCTQPSWLDWMIGERWNEALHGSRDIALSILEQWGMSTHAGLAAGGKQMFIYAPPCLHALEVALSVSMGRADISNKVFEREQQLGLPYNRFPCKIRIDERLAPHSCGSVNAAAKMVQIRDYLKVCAADQHQIPQMERAMLTELHSGPWAALHFDIPYLEQRCYANEQPAAQTEPMSMRIITADTPNAQWQTGNLILAGVQDVHEFAMNSAADRDGALVVKELRAIKLTPSNDVWVPSFYGDFTASRPPVSNLDRKQQTYNEFVQRDSDEQINWNKISGSAVAKAGFRKLKSFMK